MRALAVTAAFASATVLAGCPDSFDVEKQTFPCRAATDCVHGYVCHPTRFVCVLANTVDAATAMLPEAPADFDASLPDAVDIGAAGSLRLFGAVCTATASCDQGTCVDGRCCENACAGTCMRCDITPGKCLPAPDNTDPDRECTNQTYSCSDYTYGLQNGNACYAGSAATVTVGTCNGIGGCRPKGCLNHGLGRLLAQCADKQCVKAGACTVELPVALYDTTALLCNAGPQATCTIQAINAPGCCSASGDCCPLPSCAPVAGVCN
jgi:hypothetical protein